MKILFFILLAVFNSAFAAVNTQYPGNTPDGSTAAEVLTRPYKYYPPQVPLNKEAQEAIQAQKNQ
jgi:hypothetical protein